MLMSELNSQRYEYAVIAQKRIVRFSCQKIDVVVFVQTVDVFFMHYVMNKNLRNKANMRHYQR